MTDVDKKINWQTYIRSQLREAEDMDKTVQKLLLQFKKEDLQRAIIDMYIIQKEKRIGIHKRKNPNSYTVFSDEINTLKKDKLIFEELKNKYINENL